jgi:preprotein translocase subunit SecG
MQILLTVLQIFLSLGIIGLVLIQHGRGADAGAAFGSGASATVFGARGSGSFLSRTTAILAAMFFLTSMALAYYAAQGGKPAGLMDGVEIPAAPAVPAVPPLGRPAAQGPAIPVPVPGGSEGGVRLSVPVPAAPGTGAQGEAAAPDHAQAQVPAPQMPVPQVPQMEPPQAAAPVPTPVPVPAGEAPAVPAPGVQ